MNLQYLDASALATLAQKGLHIKQNPSLAMLGGRIAMDAQPVMSTIVNGGVPAYLTNVLDPRILNTIFTPMKMASVFGEGVYGSRTDKTVQFRIVEPTAEVSTYGDFNNNGSASYNVNYVTRESYLFQTWTQWGELEADIAQLQNINHVNQLHEASILGLNKAANQFYLYGVAGLKCYGILNDPNLLPPITAASSWTTATAKQVYDDILSLYKQLVKQSSGNVDMSTPMTLIMSPNLQPNLLKIGSADFYGIPVGEVIKKNFPNIKIEIIPEYETPAGEFMQLIVDSFDGVKTVECRFNQKLTMHALEVYSTHARQKKSQGTWGTIIYRPVFVASMIGM